MILKKIIVSVSFSTVLLLVIYYFYPIQKIPTNITIDKIVVLKSKHELLAYSKGQLIVSYKIAIGKNPTGDKVYEGDKRTPEGHYIINDKNPDSGYHKNLGLGVRF